MLEHLDFRLSEQRKPNQIQYIDPIYYQKYAPNLVYKICSIRLLRSEVRPLSKESTRKVWQLSIHTFVARQVHIW